MENQAWSLESFVDSLVVELDQTRETLAIKSINRPLSYTVKDMSLDLRIFPTYDGSAVRFRTAQPGQEGASTISLQLASITDQQIRATSKAPPAKQDVKLDETKVDSETRQTLRRLGVTSVSDLKQIEDRNVDIEKATDGKIDYRTLANLIHQARRGGTPPRVVAASMSGHETGPLLRLNGRNLALSDAYTPVAVIDNELGDVLEHGPDEVVIRVPTNLRPQASHELILTLDPYCIVRLRLNRAEGLS